MLDHFALKCYEWVELDIHYPICLDGVVLTEAKGYLYILNICDIGENKVVE
jgi:hypothetical protein